MKDLLVKARAISDPQERLAFLSEGYRPWAEKRYDDHAKRWRDIETVQAIGSRYPTTEAFLADIALDPPQETLDDIEEDDGEDEVMTLSNDPFRQGAGVEYGLPDLGQ